MPMLRTTATLVALFCASAAVHGADTVATPSPVDTMKQQAGKLLMQVRPFLVEGAYSQFHPLLKQVRENQHMEPMIPRPE